MKARMVTITGDSDERQWMARSDHVCVTGDILIYGDSEEERENNLRNLLIGLTLNKDKSMFKTSELNFLGHVVTDTGLKPDMKKAEAILRMPNSTDVEAVRRLQGLVTYLDEFLPQLSTIMDPIRRLTRQECNWEWGQEHETAIAPKVTTLNGWLENKVNVNA